MSHSDNERLPPELQDIARELRAQRPEASPLDLDRMKRQAMVQASRGTGHRPPKGMFMKSRGALTTVLVMGMLVFGTGATLAATGQLPLVSGDGGASPNSAQKSQYNNTAPGTPRRCGQQVAGERRSSRSRTRSGRRPAFTAQAQNCPPTRRNPCRRARQRGLSPRQRGRAQRQCAASRRRNAAARR